MFSTKHRKLLSLLLLGVFLISTVQSIPHFHHEHADSSHKVVLENHNHHHKLNHYDDHTHPQQQDHKENTIKIGLFDWLGDHQVDKHFHSDYFQGIQKRIKVKDKLLPQFTFASTFIKLAENTKPSSSFSFHNFRYCKSNYFNSIALRGPPSFV